MAVGEQGTGDEKFYELPLKVYTYNMEPEYDYTTPLFDSCDGPDFLWSPTLQDKIITNEPGAETSETESEHMPGPSLGRNPSTTLFSVGVVIPLDFG